MLVPENVRLEIVSDNDLTVCRDFPAILVLRGDGAGRRPDEVEQVATEDARLATDESRIVKTHGG